MSAWIVAIAAGVVTYLMRSAVPLVAGRHELPDQVVGHARLLAPAVIGALLAGTLVTSHAPAELPPRLAVLGIGFAVALRTGSIPLTICAGLAGHLLFGVVLT